MDTNPTFSLQPEGWTVTVPGYGEEADPLLSVACYKLMQKLPPSIKKAVIMSKIDELAALASALGYQATLLGEDKPHYEREAHIRLPKLPQETYHRMVELYGGSYIEDALAAALAASQANYDKLCE